MDGSTIRRSRRINPKRERIEVRELYLIMKKSWISTITTDDNEEEKQLEQKPQMKCLDTTSEQQRRRIRKRKI